MIVGLGIDVIEIERIRQALDRHGNHFIRHVFRVDEQAEAPGGTARHAFYAGRWAAKEAVSKALGTGIGERCAWTDIRIRRTHGGKPRIELSGRGRQTAGELGIDFLHITISHEGNIACAAAVAEGAPATE